MSIAYSPDGWRIISGSTDHTIQIWDTKTGAAVGKPLAGHSDQIFSVSFAPDGQHIVSGSYLLTGPSKSGMPILVFQLADL